ncbi:hypothetical protein JYK14_13480 [Siccirubricoccus sp. KC 17139]|uniref:Lipoprotein n=1 Tax=Siccirubricoccus soli TaxID=2899147 RepID=A0ABT1D5I9_9PROT|nr:hypothetical protein [Siccirubricoccus soli]MCO6417166.1 hypothetical protein [Siccirubricoccus soli]MCP2683301.1 hypothetical protein [Siccirubricoccus soli]
MPRTILAGMALLLTLAACNQGGSPGARTAGDPMRPSAGSPTGQLNSPSTGAGTPTPMQPGGSGGVGSGNQPGQGGTSSPR